MADERTVDDQSFWQLGAMPSPDGSADDSGPEGIALDRLGRPEVTVEGRNLADVLRPVYRAITAD